MAKIVAGLMNDPQDVDSIVRELTGCGCDRADVSLVTSGPRVSGKKAGAASPAATATGPIMASGPLAAVVTGTGLGAVAESLISGLNDLGVPEDEAHFYAEGVRRGGTLITVYARIDEAANCAAGVLRRYGAADIEERTEEWKQSGWSGRFFSDEQGLPAVLDELGIGKHSVTGDAGNRDEAPDTVDTAGTSAPASGMSGAYNGPERRKSRARYIGIERRAA